MARTTSNDPAKPIAPAAAATTATLPTDPANVAPGIVAGDQSLAGTVATTAGDASVTATSLSDKANDDASVNATVTGANADMDGTEDTGEVMIYPLRSYLDGKEVRRAGGKGYKSPKHDAVSLVAAGLATDKKPKA